MHVFQVFDDILLGNNDIIGLVQEHSLHAAFTMHIYSLIISLAIQHAKHLLNITSQFGTTVLPNKLSTPPSESGNEARAGINLLNNGPIDNEDKICTVKIDEKRNIIKGAMLKGFGRSLACKMLNAKLPCFISRPQLPSPPQRWFKSCYTSLDKPSQNLK